MRVALVSLDQKWEDKAENLRRCRDAVRRATELGAELVVFPEMTLTGFTMNSAAIAEPPESSPTVRAFAELAQEWRTTIAYGVVLHGAQRPTNSLVVNGNDGSELARYAKIHPFSHAREDEHYEGGVTLAAAQIGAATFGLSICYDLRFPELYTALAPDCEALLVIANWPDARIEHWHALLVARAIESQSYVIAVNRVGEDANGFHYPRSSQIIDPRGQRVAPDLVEGELELFTIDARKVVAYRRAFPTLRDRKPDLYRDLLSPAS